MPHGLLLLLLFVVVLLQGIDTCPLSVADICQCEDLGDGGVSLNCSDSDGERLVELLRASQTELGLIQKLELRRSKLSKLTNGFFSGLYIKKLDVSWNEIIDVNEDAFVGMDGILQELLLHHNNLTSLPSMALSRLSALTLLDVSNNSIGDLRESDALPALDKLFDVNLAANRISFLHKSVFGRVRGLQTLNLGHNNLKMVPASAIRGFKQLLALHLHRNEIESIDALSMMNLPMLNLLNLAGNRIVHLHRQAFLNVPGLRYLYLSDNRISQLQPDQLRSFDQLEMIDLTRNYLVHIPRDAFAERRQLRQVYLGENRLTHIEPGAFRNTSIVVLMMQGNQLRYLTGPMFDGLNHLQQLSLKDNLISSLEQNTFYGCPSLAMVDLAGNNLLDLPPATFLAQLNVFLVDLSRNKLIRTPVGAFSRRVMTVILQENPLVCTEKVHMLQQGVAVFIPNSEDRICGDRPSIGSIDNLDNDQSSPLDLKPPPPPPPPPPSSSLSVLPTSFVQESSSSGVKSALIIHPLPIERPNNPSPALLSRPRILSSIRSSTSSTPTISSNSISPSATTTPTTTTTTSTGQGPIQPFPVPFLSLPPKMYPAFAATTKAPTLPPSIVIAPKHPLPSLPSLSSSSSSSIESNRHGGSERRVDFYEPEQRTPSPSPKRSKIGVEVLGESVPFESTPRLSTTNPTTIMIVCLTTVAVVMLAVFIGLCVSRHRQMQRLFGSSSASSATAARTNAYVAAQMIYGSTQRSRSTMMVGRPNIGGLAEDSQTWIYAPSSYSSNYYK